MSDPRITIAIPYYRGLDYLLTAIASVRQQTQPAWHLIVCDDGPDLGVEKPIEAFKDSRIRYYRNDTNLGMAGNWNRCLDLADTDLVTLLHADDVLRPNYTERITTLANANPSVAAVFCAADIIGPTGQPVFSLADFVKRFLWPNRGRPELLGGQRVLDALCIGNFLMCPTACYRKSVLGTRRFGSRWRFVLDLEFFTQLLLDGDQLMLTPERLYGYRRHAGNATETYTNTTLRFQEESTFYDELAIILEARGWYRAARRARSKPLVRLNAIHRALSDLLQFQPRRALQRLPIILGQNL